MAESKNTFLVSRTGGTFGAEAEVESDGSLVILSNDGHGYRSAHRDYAAHYFNHQALWRMNNVSWLNLDGVRVRLTRWNTQAFRKAPAANLKGF